SRADRDSRSVRVSRGTAFAERENADKEDTKPLMRT
ncbi:hypothetical protein CEXT_184001, partial [Caerostris extrusa]